VGEGEKGESKQSLNDSLEVREAEPSLNHSVFKFESACVESARKIDFFQRCEQLACSNRANSNMRSQTIIGRTGSVSQLTVVTTRSGWVLRVRFPLNSELLLPKPLGLLPWERPNPQPNSVSTPRHQRTSTALIKSQATGPGTARTPSCFRRGYPVTAAGHLGGA
jgi:hypothetical protein